MKWMQERDLLIAQTMKFVQSLTGPNPSRAIELPTTEAAGARESSVADYLGKPGRLVEPVEPLPKIDGRAEILARVASFRAHQLRLQSQREQYFNETLAAARASLRQ